MGLHIYILGVAWSGCTLFKYICVDFGEGRDLGAQNLFFLECI